MLIIVLAWVYVLAMMAITLAVEPGGSMFGAIVLFLVGGFGPPALLLSLWRMARRRRDDPAQLRLDPDGGGEPPADAVAPERKES